MPPCKSIYDPQEDSTMLEKWVRKYAFGKVLDVGTGSGIQAIAAAQKHDVKSVLATDVQRGVIAYCRKSIKNKKIRFVQSDLFKNIKGKFDAIIFNPPYLPQELKLKDLTIEGGKKGYEVIERFLNEVSNFLKPDGVILIAFSSLTKKEKLEEFIKNNLLDSEELGKEHIFFEDIYVYKLTKNSFLRKLGEKGIFCITYLTKGHRGLLFTGNYKDKKIAIKVKNPKSKAVNRIENEAKWLKKLEKYNFAPKLILIDEDFFAYEYIEGDFIVDYIRKSNKSGIKKIIKKIFNQLRILDRLNLDKEEMHHPLKHIIIKNNKPCHIDFERMHYAQEPKNVTQFCQFITSQNITLILNNKKILISKEKIIGLAKVYKNSRNLKNFRKITGII